MIEDVLLVSEMEIAHTYTVFISVHRLHLSDLLHNLCNKLWSKRKKKVCIIV